MLCPIHCKKEKLLFEMIDDLNEDKKILAMECKKLRSFHDIWNSLCKIEQEGHRIIGMEEKEGAYYVILGKGIRGRSEEPAREIQLHRLPFRSTGDWIAYISLDYCDCCSADIGAIEARPYNRGYGSILMKHTLSFLRFAGFRAVTGRISPVDFGHIDRLHHFYGKFGFQITPRSDSQSLHLDISEKKTPRIAKEGAAICCRDSRYPIFRNQELLAAEERKQL